MFYIQSIYSTLEQLVSCIETCLILSPLILEDDKSSLVIHIKFSSYHRDLSPLLSVPRGHSVAKEPWAPPSNVAHLYSNHAKLLIRIKWYIIFCAPALLIAADTFSIMELSSLFWWLYVFAWLCKLLGHRRWRLVLLRKARLSERCMSLEM